MSYAFISGKVPDGGLLVHTRRGNKLTANDFFDVTTVWACFCGSDYVVPRDARLIVDLGANIGAFAVAAAEIARDAKVFSVEPFPSTRAHLDRHVRENDLADRISIRNYAVSGSIGRAKMAVGGWGSASTHLLVSGDESKQDHQDVECLSLADALQDAMRSSQAETVDMLKVDIEGSEHGLFTASIDVQILSRVREIQMEYHRLGSKDTLFATLSHFGFRCVRDEARGENYGVAHFTSMGDRFSDFV